MIKNFNRLKIAQEQLEERKKLVHANINRMKTIELIKE